MYKNSVLQVQSCCFTLSSYAFLTLSSPLHLKLPIIDDTLWSVNRIFSEQIELLLYWLQPGRVFDSSIIQSILCPIRSQHSLDRLEMVQWESVTRGSSAPAWKRSLSILCRPDWLPLGVRGWSPRTYITWYTRTNSANHFFFNPSTTAFIWSFSFHMERCISSFLNPFSFPFKLINWLATTSTKINLSSDTSFWIFWPILTELHSQKKVTFCGKIHYQFRCLHPTLKIKFFPFLKS